MAAKARSTVFSLLKGIQRVVGWVFLLMAAGFLVLFALQFPHSPKLDLFWVVLHIRNLGDPVLAECASLIRSSWPAQGVSFLPLVVALLTWLVKLGFDAGFNGLGRLAGKKILPPEPSELLPELARLGGLPADSERARDGLLKRYREIEDALKSARRKRCAFLSVDVVGSTQMKVGEEETAVAATFQAWEEMLNRIFEQHGAWKVAWTPDGVMVCFLQLDLAVVAGQGVLESLREFNQTKNKLRTSFRVRCGLNEGEVAIFEDSKLEKVADRIIDVAGHMQKQTRPDALWISSEVHSLLTEKTGFRRTKQEVDGYTVYEWIPEALRGAMVPEEVTAVASSVAAPRAAAPVRREGPRQRIGRYEIVGELGRGAMGAVYKARDPQIGRTVAIKTVRIADQSPEEAEEYKARFYREAQTAGQMSHPGIVTIYDVNEDVTGEPYLVMEFVEGKTLESVLAPASAGKPGPAKNLKELLDIAIQVADALDYAHRRGVTHRDIKPANILVTQEWKAKIADLGIAKMGGTQLTRAGLLVGTPAFMSPEQVAGGKVDARSDIFSFGVVIYWMFTGVKPFPGDSVTEVAYKVVHAAPTPPRELNADLPAEMETIISRCLAKKPDARYASARDLVADLEALKAGYPTAAAPLPTAPRPAS